MIKGKVKHKEPIDRIVWPFQKFARLEASGGILLLLCTITALAWANSPWRESYHTLWQLPLGFKIGEFFLTKELVHWINDGLMAIFFFVVGMEIKRELVEGELSTAGKAIIPVAAALGGMLIPALLFLALNAGKEGSAGWGIPMATDIAFAMGVVLLLGSRVPAQLRIFLLALAIVDDLGAVLVIALFYTADISLAYLGLASGIYIVLTITNLSGVRNSSIYLMLGFVLWYALLKSGVHATISGVLMASMIPLRSRINAAEFVERSQQIVDRFQKISDRPQAGIRGEEQQLAVKDLEDNCDRVESPLRRFEHALHPWVSFLIMPLFAFANAGISLDASAFSNITHPVSLGIIVGLVIGKQVGITLFSWLSVKSGFARLPQNVQWKQLYAISCLGGIGFTMSIFVAGLAYSDIEMLSMAKLAILLASLTSAIIGVVALMIFNHRSSNKE